jgi:hypothetical protein
MVYWCKQLCRNHTAAQPSLPIDITCTLMCECVSTDMAGEVAAAAAASHATPVASQGTWPETAQIDGTMLRRTTAEADLQQRTAVAAGGKHSCHRGNMIDDDAFTCSACVLLDNTAAAAGRRSWSMLCFKHGCPTCAVETCCGLLQQGAAVCNAQPTGMELAMARHETHSCLR